jgi:SAM-dependent methyltransferase
MPFDTPADQSRLDDGPSAKPGIGRAASRYLRVLFPLTVFLGAFLLFLLEPLFAKLILPRFGGSAAVWATCLVFFQSTLLLGYWYADIATRRLEPAWQSAAHISLLVVSLAFLPIAPRGTWAAAGPSHPAAHILVLLTLSIGLPFVLLSATSPLLQAWHARALGGSEPYSLFALSNFASLLALLSFPFVIEPRISSHHQTLLWSAVFGIFVVCCSITAWLARSASPAAASAPHVLPPTPGVSPPPGEQPTVRAKMLWLSLSACGSMLLLSTTNHLMEDVAPVPLLWVLPLALYLLTFTLAFNRRSFYSPWWMARLLGVTLGSLGYAIYEPSFTESLQVSVPLFCIGLFVCCWFCHGELALRRPDPRHLTSFYLMIALGGAIGAISVGLLAPYLFAGNYEFPLTLCLTAALAGVALWRAGRLARVFWAAATMAMAAVLVYHVHEYRKDAILTVRNFYGSLRVNQYTDWLKQPYRALYHGKIEHGAQSMVAPKSLKPTTYYGPKSGVGITLDWFSDVDRRVGVIGLGTGTLAAYGEEGDYFRFYEINPLMVSIARGSFTYLRDTKAQVEITMGDARLSLASEAPQQFDVLALDAFSGDAIPVHLLTKEAFALYLRHLKPGGVLAVHTSNTYLDLAPVVKLLADDAGCLERLISNSDEERKLIDASDWVLVTRNKRFIDELDNSVVADEIKVPPKLRLWTDDYNNLFQILRAVDFKKMN